nr:CD2 antigen cytoplasmic tail-binding protein 2 homolog [Onthophagus taurus]
MSKRKFDASEPFETVNVARKYQKRPVYGKKHTLDSDEEDFQDDDNVLDENEIEGEEDGTITEDGEQRMTAFNMQEEMELGHFDKDGHFIWKNEKEVRDNWLDNIDWQQIKRNANIESSEPKGLGEESDSENEENEHFDEIKTYKLILTYLKPTETISKALRRLGGPTEKLSSIERLKRKKAGTLNTNKEVTELTELSNKILNNLGNMDVYQETYEFISGKIQKYEKKNKSKKNEPELDMYSDNFDDKEKEKLGLDEQKVDDEEENVQKVLMWELKRDQNKEEIEGPFTSEQMLKWSEDGSFKTGVFVRKCGESGNFYSSNRIDFDLYI